MADLGIRPGSFRREVQEDRNCMKRLWWGKGDPGGQAWPRAQDGSHAIRPMGRTPTGAALALGLHSLGLTRVRSGYFALPFQERHSELNQNDDTTDPQFVQQSTANSGLGESIA